MEATVAPTSQAAPPPRLRDKYEQDILPRWFAIYAATPLLGYWAAEDRESGEFLGWFHLRPDRIEPEHQELGYRLRRAIWGRGYATEGGTALVGHGFGPVAAASNTRDPEERTLDLRVQIATNERGAQAARGLVRQMGLTTVRQYGRFGAAGLRACRTPLPAGSDGCRATAPCDA